MDSKAHVPLSATPAAVQAYPFKSSLSSSTSSGSFLIRAPLTIDDDDDDDLESGSHKTTNDTDSGKGTDSLSNTDTEGFVSGEEYDTASERLFLAEPDKEISEKNDFVDKLKISKLIFAGPDEEYSQKSTVDDEESSVGDEYYGPVVDMALVDNPKLKILAQLSMDDDDDGVDELVGGEEGVVSEGEDGGFSYVAKVPSVGYLERVNSAPRLKVMENEGGSEDELFSVPPSPAKSVDSSVSPSEDALLGNDSVNDLVSVEDKGDGFAPETRFKSIGEGKEDVFEVVDNSFEREPALENSAVENRDENEIKERADETVVTVLEDLKIEEAGVDAGEKSDCQNDKFSSVDVSGSLSLDQGGDKENLESKPEREIELGVNFHDPLSVIAVDSMSGAIKGDEIQIGDSKLLLQNANLHALTDDSLEDAESRVSSSLKFVELNSILDQNIKQEAELDVARIGGRQNGVVSDDDIENLIFEGSETAKQFMEELEERLASPSTAGAEGSQDQSEEIDGQIIMESEDEGDTDSDGEKKELFESDALAALLKAASGAGSDGGGLTITSADSSRVFTFEKPTGAGSDSSSPSRGSAPPAKVDKDVSKDKLSDEEKERIEKIQLLRVRFLGLVKRLGHSLDDSIVAQVLYRLALAMGSHGSQVFSLESAKSVAMQCEAEGKDDLDFSLNILVLGKTGVGKSATINSLFREEKATIDAFEPATTSVKLIAGVIDGVKIKILDTPGLRSPVTEQSINRRILASIKKFMKKFTPDVVLYVDRLDTDTRDHNDLLLLRSLTSSLSSSIWQNAILCLTHAASDPPDGPSGSPLSYEVFVAQRSRVIQRDISQAVGDLRLMNPSMMHPVSLVENHPSCRKNTIGDRLLPNGQSWRPQLLLLCFSLKILAEANSVSKSRDHFDHKKLFGFRRSAPLSYLLSSLLQSRTHPKLSADQGGDDVDSDVELCDSSDSEHEDEDEYSQLPPFKPLRKSQVANLSKEEREAYFEEYDYRVKLLQKKQWKDEVRRLTEIKKKGDGNNYDYHMEDEDHEDESRATIPVTLPDFILPPSFDGGNPTYRYRFLEPSSELLVRPVLDSHGWDHDCGYDGVSLERNLAIAGQFPGALAVQITKDKKEFNVQFDSSISAKYGENGSTMAGLDVQTVGRQLAYILRGETKFRNFRINKTCAGLSMTFLGENVATGLKIEDQIALGKGLFLVGNAGAMRSQGDVAYGANLEVRLKDEDFPIVQDQSSLGLSLMNWRGDLTLMAKVQSQLSIGRSSKMAVRIGLNNKRSGQITVKLSSSEQLQMALFGIVPVAISTFRSIFSASGGKNSTY